MPVVGERVDPQKVNRSYEKNEMHKLAEQFLDVAQGSLNESGLDIFTQPQQFFMHNSTKDQMKDFFVNEMYDQNDPEFKDAESIQEYEESLGELFENDLQGVRESAPLGSFNPVIGITFPMHKNLLQTTVFDKAIPKDIAASPKFTLTMETRTLVDAEGNEIDMFYEQSKIHDAVKNSVPSRDVVVALPEDNTLDIVKTYYGGSGNLSMQTCITGVVVNAYVAVGGATYDLATGKAGTQATAGMADTIVPINKLEFSMGYGDYDYTIMEKAVVTFADSATTTKTINPTISGYMKSNKFMILSSLADIKGVQIHAVMDVSSAGFDEPYVKWSAKTTPFQIPEAPHIATSVSPEEVKDVNALYQVNQLTKIMSMMNLALANYKDDEIRLQLNDSFLKLDKTQKVSGSFDFIPPQNYLADPIAWRQSMFMDYLDTQVTYMLQVLNDENMTITVFGRPDLIRKITPTDYSYQTPSSIGPVELDYKKTVVTSDRRTYQFISSQKLRNTNNLIVILCPRNTQRVVYKIFDYQFYVSNEIRTVKGYPLPAITAFERWKMIQYQPVQGRIAIKNPMGLREVLDNDDPIGTSAMNEYDSNKNTYASVVNGGVLSK